MKKCPKCELMNFDNATLCESCSAYIADVEADSTDVLEQIMQEEEKNERFWKIFHILLVVIYYAIYIPLFAVCFRKSGSTPVDVLLLPAIFPLFYYLSVFKAEAMFKLSHIFQIDNIDDVHVSEWYHITSKIGGYIILIMGIVCMINFLPHKPSDDAIVVSVTWSIFDHNIEVITDELTGQKIVIDKAGHKELEYDAFLKENNAVFLENSEDAKGLLETIYQNVRKGSFTPPRILVDGEKVYEFIFNGKNLKMCETAPYESANGMGTTYHYNCKIEKNENGYLISDFRTGLKLEFTF